jgi:diacylglycerol kinase family enzyme
MGTALIINPVAGGVNKGVINKVKHRFGNEVTIYYTSFKGGNFEIPGFDKSDFERKIVMGGDGTLNDTVNFLLNPHTNVPLELGWIPRGTGNGYSQALDNPKRWTKSIETVLEGEARPVDVVHLTEPVNVYSLNFLDIGGIARILQNRNVINQWAKVNLKINSTGIVGYTMAILKTAITMPTIYIEEAFVDRQRIPAQKVVDVVIGKGFTPNYFPIMGVLPKGELNDGKLRVAIYQRGDIYNVLNMVSQRIVDRDEYTGKRIRIVISGETSFQMDGNLNPYKSDKPTLFDVIVESEKIKMIF